MFEYFNNNTDENFNNIKNIINKQDRLFLKNKKHHHIVKQKNDINELNLRFIYYNKSIDVSKKHKIIIYGCIYYKDSYTNPHMLNYYSITYH